MRNQKAFTLVELLVVIGIICVLAGLIVPGIIGRMQDVNKVECVSQMRQIYQAMISYSNNYNGRFPWAGRNKMPWDHLQILVDKGYIRSPKLLVVQSIHRWDEYAERTGKKKKFKLSEATCSFTTYDRPIAIHDDPETIVLCNKSMEAQNGFENGWCRVRLDGSAKFEDAMELPSGIIKVEVVKGTDTGTGGDTSTDPTAGDGDVDWEK